MGFDEVSELLPLGEIAKLLPPRNGKSLGAATVRAWHHRGCQGVRLECVKVGGRLMASKEALMNFFRALSAKSSNPKQD